MQGPAKPTVAKVASKELGKANAEQRTADRALLHTEEVTPGLPPMPPTEPSNWKGQVPEEQQAAQRAKQDEAERKARQHLQPPTRRAKTRRNKKANRIDKKLQQGDWDLVYDAYQYSGDIDTIVELTDLKRDEVEHLLNIGLLRLQLPAIRDHAVNKAQLERDIQRVRDEQSQALALPQTQQAIQERVTQETAAVQKALGITIMGNDLLNVYATKLQEMLANQLIAMPETITPDLIKHFVSALETHSRTLERIVKLQRLNQGQATDIVTQQIVGLIASCTTEELEEAEKHGRLPPTIVPTRGGETDTKSAVIDADFDEVDSDNS